MNALRRLVMPNGDLATPEGRAAERHRRAIVTSAASIVARAATVVALFVAIRMVSGVTTAEAFGVWLVLVSAVSLVGFADLGIGNGLLNVIAHAQGREDDQTTRQAISSAFFTLTALAVALGIGFAVFYPLIDWAGLLNVTGPTTTQVGPAVAAFVVCTLVSLPLGVAQRVSHAHQRGWVANLWQAFGAALSIVGVVIASATSATLPVLVAAALAGPPAAYLLDSAFLYFGRHRQLRPRLRLVTRDVAGQVLRNGLLFFVLATVTAVGYQSDSLVIAHFLGADQVQLYAVPFRLFMLAPSLVTMLVTPLWPAYGEAVARGDHAWVHTTLRRSLLLAFSIAVVPSALLIVLAQPIINLWVQGTVQPPRSLLVGLAAWAVINGVSTALAMFFNGAGALRIQVVIAAIMGLTNIALSIVLVQQIGVAGPIWATVLTQVLCGMVPAWFIARDLLRRSDDPEQMTRWLRRWADRCPS